MSQSTPHKQPTAENQSMLNDRFMSTTGIGISEEQMNPEVRSELVEGKENTKHIDDGSSILIVGATGMVGLKLLKHIKQLKAENQVIYVLARRNLIKESSDVKVKVCEASQWPAEIAKIPNLKVVYSALGYRPRDGYYYAFNLFEPLHPSYEVIHNMTYQVATAAKEAGAKRFVFVSHYTVNYPHMRLLNRQAQIRRETEDDLVGLNFDSLFIMRPGPLVGLREKPGSWKGFSLTSIDQCLFTIFLLPQAQWFLPLTIFNFSSSVGKTGASLLEIEDGPHFKVVSYINKFEIVFGSTYFNASRFLGLMDGVKARYGEIMKLVEEEQSA